MAAARQWSTAGPSRRRWSSAGIDVLVQRGTATGVALGSANIAPQTRRRGVGAQEAGNGLTGHQPRVGHGGIVGAFGTGRDESEAVASVGTVMWSCGDSQEGRIPDSWLEEYHSLGIHPQCRTRRPAPTAELDAVRN